jgi:LmbE family N-acetylglucosaminyl deacetylase
MADGESSRMATEPEGITQHRIAARKDAAEGACRILGAASIEMLMLPDNRMDGTDLLEIVRPIEERIARYRPTTLFTHHSSDVNVDHRMVHEALLAVCRPQPFHCVKHLLFFEVSSSTEWRPPGSRQPFSPNVFVDVSATLPIKLEALRAYGAELRPFPHPRSVEAVEALARWRGATAGVHAAEAFVLGRSLI